MLCLALGGVCLQVAIGERDNEVERLTLAVLCVFGFFREGWCSLTPVGRHLSLVAH